MNQTTGFYVHYEHLNSLFGPWTVWFPLKSII